MNTSEIGERTEAIVLAELVKRGFRPLLPFGNSRRYDFVLDMPDGFLRVQCKTGRLRKGVVTFHAVSVTKSWAAKTTEHRDYREDADVFIVHCPELDAVYWVPVEQVGTEGRLRVKPTANGQAAGVKWAADFLLPSLSASGASGGVAAAAPTLAAARPVAPR